MFIGSTFCTLGCSLQGQAGSWFRAAVMSGVSTAAKVVHRAFTDCTNRSTCNGNSTCKWEKTHWNKRSIVYHTLSDHLQISYFCYKVTSDKRKDSASLWKVSRRRVSASLWNINERFVKKCGRKPKSPELLFITLTWSQSVWLASLAVEYCGSWWIDYHHPQTVKSTTFIK